MSIFDLIIVQPIFNLVMALYTIIPGHDFGIALIIFTIIIRIVMWPLVVKQLHQVKAMRKLQPELKQLKKKAKGNKQLEGVMSLELYKKHNVNPFRSIFILLIQLPIFIGLYHVIQIFTVHRDELGKFTYSFLENWEPIRYLIANPDSFNEMFLGFIDLTQHAIGGSGATGPFLFIIAISAGILQYISTKQTMPQSTSSKGLRQIMSEAAEGKEADQAEMNAVVMQKMVKFIPIFMVFVMINLPGALALYYAVSTCVAVGQQYILLRHDKDEMEEIADSPDFEPAKKRAKKAKTAQVVDSKPKAKTTKTAKTTKKSVPKKKDKSDDGIIRITAKPNKKKGGR